MKKFVQLIVISILGGAVTLGSYKVFFEDQPESFGLKNEQKQHQPEPSGVQFIKNHYSTNASEDGSLEDDFKEAAKKTVHAVVHVKNVAVNRQPRNLSEYLRGMRGGESVQGAGSGVIITPDGYIVTNNHVIQNASKIEVTLNNNLTYEAEVIGADPDADIALIKIDGEELDYLPFGNSDQVEIGQWALAVGNPFNLTSTVTAGIVSAKGRDLNEGDTRLQSFIQTDAAINPGNSGGALVNDEGELIGINTAITSRTGSYIGYGFAVPSNNARKIVEDLMEYGDVQHAILGVSAQTINPEKAKKNELPISQGVRIEAATKGAAEAGLKNGDLIVKVDGMKVKKLSDLTSYIATKRPEDEVQVNYIRNGEENIARVSLSEYKTYTLPTLELELTEASEEYLNYFGTDQGVRIAKSLSREYKIPENQFIITALDGKRVNSIEEVKKIMEDKTQGDPVKITFRGRNGNEESYIFRP